ncbi:MAG: multidrug efflux SMR transporter [Planctomycetota bacterium]|nr:multidrug efflux SMR transporter [Planctomycetota bacterium]
MSWIVLLAASVFECVGAISLKASDGFRRRSATIRFVVAMMLSMGMLAMAAETLPIGTAYAVWTGLGAVGTAVWGMVRLGESASRRRVACLALIVGGVVLLRLAEGPG